jgi:hypothetical protein
LSDLDGDTTIIAAAKKARIFKNSSCRYIIWV